MADKRRVLVTGCSTGLGRATAVALARSGWDVVATVRKDRYIADLLEEEPSLTVMSGFDLEDPQIGDMARKLRPHALINNAGYGLWGPVETIDPDELQRLFSVHVFGVVRLVQAVLPGMRQLGAGHVVNIGSTADQSLSVGNAAYAASKAALRTLTVGLALELRPFGVQVSLVEPGKYATQYSRNRVVATTATRTLGQQYLVAHKIGLPPQERPGEREPTEVAQLIVRILDDPHPRTVYREEDLHA